MWQNLWDAQSEPGAIVTGLILRDANRRTLIDLIFLCVHCAFVVKNLRDARLWLIGFRIFDN